MLRRCGGEGRGDMLTGRHHAVFASILLIALAPAPRVRALGAAPSWTGEGNQANAHYGWSVAPAGDVDGDGYTDLIVGAREHDAGQTNEGRVTLYRGSHVRTFDRLRLEGGGRPDAGLLRVLRGARRRRERRRLRGPHRGRAVLGRGSLERGRGVPVPGRPIRSRCHRGVDGGGGPGRCGVRRRAWPAPATSTATATTTSSSARVDTTRRSTRAGAPPSSWAVRAASRRRPRGTSYGDQTRRRPRRRPWRARGT